MILQQNPKAKCDECGIETENPKNWIQLITMNLMTDKVKDVIIESSTDGSYGYRCYSEKVGKAFKTKTICELKSDPEFCSLECMNKWIKRRIKKLNAKKKIKKGKKSKGFFGLFD